MEPAWEKVQAGKFSLLQKSYDLPNGGKKMMPYYSLTKTECLYIATKFKDEMRAKLVLRWEELERERLDDRQQLALPSPQKILAMADQIVGEGLIQKHGLNGAEAQLKQNPSLWKELLLKAQTPQLLEAYDVIADALLENALYFFRDRIENAFASRDYAGHLSGERSKRGRNDSIFARLDVQFTFEQAMQFSVAMKGAGVTHNSVRQMLKNWRKQGLVVLTDDGNYRKMS